MRQAKQPFVSDFLNRGHMSTEDDKANGPNVVNKKRWQICFELLPHLRHSSDLVPRDIFLFSNLKKLLAGKKYSDCL